jgi:uncharacterized membrane protein YkvA (DUF1232 family)
MTQPNTPPSKDSNWIRGFIRQLRLSWRLFWDPLVPIWTKLIPLAAVAYVILPVDFIPDAIIGLGQMDDLGIVLLSLKLFVDLSPGGVVEHHLAEMSSVKADFRVVQDDTPQTADVAGHLEAPHTPAEAAPPDSVEKDKGGSA